MEYGHQIFTDDCHSSNCPPLKARKPGQGVKVLRTAAGVRVFYDLMENIYYLPHNVHSVGCRKFI